jgi:hypothetical protein
MSLRRTQEHLRTDLRKTLKSAGLSIGLYQRLEVLFRQTMIQSAASNYEYAHFEAPLELQSLESGLDLVRAVDNSLDKWARRYPDGVYGFEQVRVSANATKRKPKSDYCRVIETLDLLADLHPDLLKPALLENWICDLRKNMISIDPGKASQGTRENFALLDARHFDYLKCYLGFSLGIFLPHFPDLETLAVFLTTKLSVEKGAPVRLDSVLDGEPLHLLLLAHEPMRLGMVKKGLAEALFSSGTGPNRTRIAS